MDSSYQKFSNNDTEQTPKDIRLKDNGDSTYSIATNDSLRDKNNNRAYNTIIGERIVAYKEDKVNVMFQYNVSDYDVVKETSGTGSITHENAKAQLHTGTGVGKSIIYSKDVLLYTTGKEVNAEMTQIFGTPEENTIQIQGLGNEYDTIAGFGYNGLTFGIWLQTVESGSKYHVPLVIEDLNPQFYNIYRVKYGWYGILPIRFEYFNATLGDWVQVYEYSGVNTTSNPHLANPTQPLINWVERTTGSGSDIVLQTSSWRGCILGKREIYTRMNRKFMIKTVKSTSTNTPIISIRSKQTFQGLRNNVKVRIGTFTSISDGAQPVQFDIYSTGTLTGGTWIERDPENSTIEYNNTATSFTPPVGVEPDGGTGIAKVDRDRINLFSNDIIISLRAGEELHVVANGNNNIINYFRVIEEF